MRELSRVEHSANYANNYEEVKAMAIEISFTAGFVVVAFLFGYVLGLAKKAKQVRLKKKTPGTSGRQSNQESGLFPLFFIVSKL